jgi:hypothetical protein
MDFGVLADDPHNPNKFSLFFVLDLLLHRGPINGVRVRKRSRQIEDTLARLAHAFLTLIIA